MVEMLPVQSGPAGMRPHPDARSTSQRDLARASEEFEAIFLRQMLASARATSFDDDELFGGAGLETFSELRDKAFADLASQTGQLGLAARIEAHLATQRPKG